MCNRNKTKRQMVKAFVRFPVLKTTITLKVTIDIIGNKYNNLSKKKKKWMRFFSRDLSVLASAVRNLRFRGKKHLLWCSSGGPSPAT
jgi:hypothetical protein